MPYSFVTSLYVMQLLIVDDEILRVGSSNFNNRSQRLDSESMCSSIAATGNGHAATPFARSPFVAAEHCGLARPRSGSARTRRLAAMIVALGNGAAASAAVRAAEL